MTRIAVRAASRRRSCSNSDKPSGPITTASPSIVKLLALICSAAAAIVANHTVQSYALRLYSRNRGAITANDHPVIVMLDFVDPSSTGRRHAMIMRLLLMGSSDPFPLPSAPPRGGLIWSITFHRSKPSLLAPQAFKME
jgi:hypothetical protein